MLPENVVSQIDVIREACNRIKPLVVIDCTTYNHEPYIKDAIEGFVQQKTNFPFVALIHDDASTDNTAEIIRQYAEKYPDIIFPIYETENQYTKGKGTFKVLSQIMNEACEATGAKYVALCEGDDYWIDPYKLQKQVDFLETNPDYGMVYTKARRYLQSEDKFIEPMGREYMNVEEMILEPYQIPTASVLYRMDIKKKIYDQLIKDKYWAMGDYPQSLGFATISKIKYISEETTVYRILDNSACHFKTYEAMEAFYNSSYQVEKFFAKINNLQITSIIEINHNLNLFHRSQQFNNYKKTYELYKKIKNYGPKEKGFKGRIRKFLYSNYPTFILSQKIRNK